jgi:SAM-dependent methyltransferase
MSKFQITLIRPQGYPHTEAFRELAETLHAGLEILGHSSRIQENCFDSAGTNLILGAHLLVPGQMQIIPRGSIIYNLEQLGGAQLNPAYYQLATSHRIWDYDLRNIEHWKQFKCAYAPVHVPIGYVQELSRIKPSACQDIDVLFYGSLNPRRNRILNALKDAGLNVHAVFGVYGKERDDLIARAKLVLNIHFYESKVFEIVRVSYLLANSKAVVTELSSGTEMEDGLSDAVLGLPYEQLVEGCRTLLKNDTQRRAFETRGFQWFSQRKESDILSNALQTPAVSTSTANTVEIPRKLNMGSGKDWREDCFNTDFDPYWEPDAVLDFSRALPIGQPLETQRFGTVVLQNNWFDEIIANDVLEHIPNLTLAMTSCLNLLRVGGVFCIAVPYDLSWGAWQDPTHVRAFNERSWLYYTDWFWYMGWTEARFDLAQFDLGLSPIGEALAKQQVKGEDLVRHPRAVDQLRVVLRKRLLTAIESQQVEKYLRRPNRSAARGQAISVKMQPAAAQAAPAL